MPPELSSRAVTAPTVLQHRYVPRGAAARVWECRDDEILLDGPAGTGKSRALLEKLHLMALINPGMRGLMLRKTLVSLTSTGLVTFRTHVAAEAIEAGDIVWYGGSSQEPAQYRYSNGATIAVGGMDKPKKIMSSEYDVIYVQEATELTEEDWESATTRLRNRKISFQQIMGDCNPEAPTHWLNERANRGTTTRFRSRHEDNPVLFDDDGVLTEFGESYMARLDRLTGVRHARLRQGIWAAAEGVIYDEWDENVHVIPKAYIPKEWTRYWSIDFGHTNPFVLQCWAEDPDGRLILYREIYQTRRLVEDHVETIMRKVLKRPEKQQGEAWRGEWVEPRPRAVICDHEAEDRATFERHSGLSTVAAHKSVSTGIEAVKARLRVAGDGKPRLMIMRDARMHHADSDLVDGHLPTCTLEEIPGYVWAVKPGNAQGLKEEPVKENDHGEDAKRYLVAHVDLAPRPRIRVM